MAMVMGATHLDRLGTARGAMLVARIVVAAGIVVAMAIWQGLIAGLASGAVGLLLGALVPPSRSATRVGHNGVGRFEEELERARRFGVALTLVRVPGAGEEGFSYASHPSGTYPVSRRIDVQWLDGADLFFALYDTRDDGAQVVLSRLRSCGIDTDGARVAVFPDTALTAGAMWAHVCNEAVAPRVAAAAPLLRADVPESAA